MIRILIIEDERPISDLLRLSFSKAGYTCECAFDGLSALELVKSERFNLLLIDIMLPEVSGYEILDYIKSLGIPVIFITAKNSVNDRVKGLKMGADDYITKPFEIIELLARVEVVLKRYNKLDNVVEICGLSIDTDSRTVTKCGTELCLTKKEYEMLLLFCPKP